MLVHPCGTSGQIGEYSHRVLFILFLRGQTARWIFTLYGSNDADSYNDVPFWCFTDIAPLL